MTDNPNRDLSGAVNHSPGMNEREGLLAQIPADLPDDIQHHLFALEDFIGDCDGKNTVISNGETCIDDGTIDASDAVAGFNGIVAALRSAYARNTIAAPAQSAWQPDPRTIEECLRVALEQRCERDTPWDLACTTIAEKISALGPSSDRGGVGVHRSTELSDAPIGQDTPEDDAT